MNDASRRLTWNLFAAVVVLALIGYVLATRDATKATSNSGDGGGAADEPASAAAQEVANAPGPTGRGSPLRDGGGPILDRAKADRMREAIRAALAAPREPDEPNAANAGGSAQNHEHAEMPSSSAGDGGALRDYIRSVIHDDYFPLAKQCYEASLAKNPKLKGRISLGFEIVGDKKIGGVVNNAEYDDEQTTIIDPELRTCLRESMMSVSFDAPPKDGKVTVKYPIVFSPDEPDE